MGECGCILSLEFVCGFRPTTGCFMIMTKSHIWKFANYVKRARPKTFATRCPALATARNNLDNALQSKLIHWKVPFADRLISFEPRICESWQSRALKELGGVFDISLERIQILTQDFWVSNIHKPTIPRSTFIDRLRAIFPKKALVS